MRNGAVHGSKNGRALKRLGAVGPDGNEPSYVFINPSGPPRGAFALEAHLGGRSVRAGTVEFQRPSIAADGTQQKFRRGFCNHDGSVAEKQRVDVGIAAVRRSVQVRVVQKTAVGPLAHKGIVTHAFSSSVRSTLTYLVGGDVTSFHALSRADART